MIVNLLPLPLPLPPLRAGARIEAGSPPRRRSPSLVALVVPLFVPLFAALVLSLVCARNAFAESDIPALVKSLRDTVVKIHVRELVVTGTERVESYISSSQGSGVLVAPAGKVLTAAHVVQTADEIEVEFNDGFRVPARVHASEPAADVALLQLEALPAGRPVASLGDSDALAVGDRLLLIGFPYGLSVTLGVGHVSGRERPPGPFGPFDGLELITTDTCVLHGCSGAPLFDVKGRVVAMATSVMTNVGASVGLGFAVTASSIRALVLERRSLWTGIGGYWVEGRLAHALNLPQRAGLLVMRVAASSPASRMRLRGGTAPTTVGEHSFVLGGDLILAMQGVSLAEPLGYQRARAALAELGDGDTLRVTVLRGGQRVELESVLER